MKNLKIGIIGYGNIGKKRHTNLKKIKKYKISLEFICEVNRHETIKKNIKNKINNWKKINPSNYDLIIICTPTNVTEKILPFFIGKTNLLVEKPGTINLKKMKYFSKLSTINNKIFKIGYNLRYDDGLIYAKSLIDNSKIGKIYHLKVTYSNGATLTNSNKVGSLVDMGAHSINLIQWLLDVNNLDIKYSLSQKNEFMKKQIADNGFVNFVYKNIICFIHHGFCNWKNKFELEIIGSKGLSQVESLPKWGIQEVIYGKRVFPSGKPKLFKKIFKKDNTWLNEINFVLDRISCGKNVKLINNEGLNTLKVIKSF